LSISQYGNYSEKEYNGLTFPITFCPARGWREENELGQEHPTDRLQEANAIAEGEERWNAFLDELLK
jgi:hypothetical protein